MKGNELRDGMVIGAAIGFAVGLLLAGFTVYRWQGEKLDRLREGWTLMGVIVFNRDLEAGAVADFDNVAKMVMPEKFVTPNMLKPREYKQIVGRALRCPVRRGDLVMRSMFDPPAPPPSGP